MGTVPRRATVPKRPTSPPERALEDAIYEADCAREDWLIARYARELWPIDGVPRGLEEDGFAFTDEARAHALVVSRERQRVAQLEAEARKRAAEADELTYGDAARDPKYKLDDREKKQLRGLYRRREHLGRMIHSASPKGRKWHQSAHVLPRALVEELVARVKARTRALRRR